MITTSDTINIEKTIRLGSVTNYSVNNVSLFMKHNGIQKRFDANSVVNSTATSTGLITFNNIPLWGDGSYSIYITAEDNNDIDSTGVNLNRLATGYVKKITNQTTLKI